jgi:hypothetical protein
VFNLFSKLLFRSGFVICWCHLKWYRLEFSSIFREESFDLAQTILLVFSRTFWSILCTSCIHTIKTDVILLWAISYICVLSQIKNLDRLASTHFSDSTLHIGRCFNKSGENARMHAIKDAWVTLKHVILKEVMMN